MKENFLEVTPSSLSYPEYIQEVNRSESFPYPIAVLSEGIYIRYSAGRIVGNLTARETKPEGFPPGSGSLVEYCRHGTLVLQRFLYCTNILTEREDERGFWVHTRFLRRCLICQINGSQC